MAAAWMCDICNAFQKGQHNGDKSKSLALETINISLNAYFTNSNNDRMQLCKNCMQKLYSIAAGTAQVEVVEEVEEKKKRGIFG